ncbi:hypothetical protein [Cellulomonas alba]|uniref:Uncharacterized protein n=1 Tax=Cellulomonas alba TaxID=3053467 RepID=A0ABT7SDI8_9CELL|nr:hypothetical protein [Cellulomonas alba]MDM7854247.1 hypothetical protein [Cellulomonas alba]
MALAWSTDVSAADWLVAASRPFTPPWPAAFRVITLGPPGYAAYARVRFIPDPVRPGQEEADTELAEDHPSDLTQVERALGVLARFTTTPDDAWFCAWEGYSDTVIPRVVLEASMVDLAVRRYGLLRGALADVDGWSAAIGASRPACPPALVWPADRSWCLAADTDPHYGGVAGSAAAIEALLAEPGLDAVRADPDAPQPAYGSVDPPPAPDASGSVTPTRWCPVACSSRPARRG